MGKTKKCIIAICIAVLLVGVGAGTIIYRQAQGNASLWGTFAKDHKDLVKKYSDWFNKDGEFYFKIAEGKKDTAWWDKIFDKVANKEEGVPEEWISEDGMHVTPEFARYARPLIQAELHPFYVDGVPRHLHL